MFDRQTTLPHSEYSIVLNSIQYTHHCIWRLFATHINVLWQKSAYNTSGKTNKKFLGKIYLKIENICCFDCNDLFRITFSFLLFSQRRPRRQRCQIHCQPPILWEKKSDLSLEPSLWFEFSKKYSKAISWLNWIELGPTLKARPPSAPCGANNRLLHIRSRVIIKTAKS